MRKSRSILVVIFLIGMTAANAQEEEKKPRFEVSFDALQFLKPYDSAVSFSFDYLLNESESISFTPTRKFDEYSFAADYKHFFSKKYAQGFYTGIGLDYNFGKRLVHSNYGYHYYYVEDYNALNLDLTLGYKLVSKKDFFIDVYASLSKTVVGQNMHRHNYYHASPIDFGFKIGKRF